MGSEKLDEYLKSEGWGLIMRKAAAAVSAYQTIEQDDKSIKIFVKNKKGEYTYTATFDGAEVKYTDADKDEKKYKTTRYMENGEMKLKVENPVSGKYCIRI